jgi:tetratricopeptide (TPR) repeat protein
MKRVAFFLFLVGLLANESFAAAPLTKEKINDLFSQANEAFRKANTQADDASKIRLYEQAILGYEKIIKDGPVRNAGLYYNLANAYLLKQDIGRAILNYRRAERLDNSNADIQKNLAFAESRRLDHVAEKTQGRVLKTLFFWHYDFSLKTRFILTIIFFAVSCVFVTLFIWFGRNALFTTLLVVFGIFLICFLCSVIWETNFQSSGIHGVITADEIVARQGDAVSYPASFKDPLHSGTDFILLEKRTGWLHIKLYDDSDGWISEDSAEII